MDTHRNTRRVGLYPPIDAAHSGLLDVGEGHQIYFEVCGRADGLPVVALHGGPGGGAAPAMRRFFDPRVYRIIIFDQRGCGRSTPHGEVEANDTGRLISDMEQLRTHLGVDRWVVFGGSWGATLALAYARACRDRVVALILRGVFACTRSEIDWFYRDGANRLFPDAWERLTARLTAGEREDVLKAYHARLSGDVEARREDAIEWARWESALICLHADPSAASPEPRRADALARMETHYFIHGGFLDYDGVLLAETGHLRDIPGIIVQGRYDMVTPVQTAWHLAKAWPSARLDIIPDAGHAAGEPGTIDALVRATDNMARRFA